MEVLYLFLIFPAFFVCLLIIGWIQDNFDKLKGISRETLGCFAFFILSMLKLMRVFMMGFTAALVPVMLWNFLVEPIDEIKYTWVEPMSSILGVILFVLIFRWLCRRYGGCREVFVGDEY